MAARATIFRFRGYRVEAQGQRALFRYRIEFADRKPLDFTETIILPRAPRAGSGPLLKKVLEPLHLMLGVSYYKLYCPPKVALPFRLSEEQAAFWSTVYKKGLGEFAYRNKIRLHDIAAFPHVKVRSAALRMKADKGPLLGIGGGKDSIVAAELLKEMGERPTAFVVETQRPDPITEKVIGTMGVPLLKIRRILDPQIFGQHAGSYNGHVPISGVFAFLGLYAAAAYGYESVVVGNEHSSDFGNVDYDGLTINHQWSKSSEFESLLQDYTRRFITPDTTYFSLLRQFYEIRIVKLFARYPKYFRNFTSCNRAFRVHKDRSGGLWCGECPKCAFIFLLFAAVLPKKDVLGIFKKNLLADENLVPLYGDLLGYGELKPFDCVGTFEESQAALYLAAKKFKGEIVTKTYLARIKRPAALVKQVFRTAPAPTLPTPYRFAGIESVCLLGYGLEGKATERYLRKFHRGLRVGILDQKRDKDYLAKQEQYDLAVKTPGIPMEKVTIPYVTATNLFFARNRNLVIGVTGSKGKSTTTSLIHAMLQAAGRKTRLLGNIGHPMLAVHLGKVDPKETFVIELSSYMLSDIEYSPDIALLLNLFPEHMDYHGGLESYYAAKRNIFKFQKPGGVAVRAPFTEKLPLVNEEIPLRGRHNRKNIQAAVKVARLLKIPDAAIRRAIKGFKALPHRLQDVGTFKGITFVDDAISTTPESTIMAIRTLPDVQTIFLGGVDRGYDFTALERALRRSKIRNIVLFPDTGARILSSRKGFRVLETRDMEEAVKFAYAHTAPGRTCLLSTASPSYSVWKNFEEKGDLFQAAARKRGKSKA